jgi:hypothetical protein
MSQLYDLQVQGSRDDKTAGKRDHDTAADTLGRTSIATRPNYVSVAGSSTGGHTAVILRAAKFQVRDTRSTAVGKTHGYRALARTGGFHRHEPGLAAVGFIDAAAGLTGAGWHGNLTAGFSLRNDISD